MQHLVSSLSMLVLVKENLKVGTLIRVLIAAAVSSMVDAKAIRIDMFLNILVIIIVKRLVFTKVRKWTFVMQVIARINFWFG